MILQKIKIKIFFYLMGKREREREREGGGADHVGATHAGQLSKRGGTRWEIRGRGRGKIVIS